MAIFFRPLTQAHQSLLNLVKDLHFNLTLGELS